MTTKVCAGSIDAEQIMSDLDAATIKELATQLTKIAGRPINAEGLNGDLECCAALYFFA
jgi:hypothetical protein